MSPAVLVCLTAGIALAFVAVLARTRGRRSGARNRPTLKRDDGAPGPTFRHVEFNRRRLDAAHRRYLSALKPLAWSASSPLRPFW